MCLCLCVWFQYKDYRSGVYCFQGTIFLLSKASLLSSALSIIEYLNYKAEK